MRPRPTAPENWPTRRSQASRSGCSAAIVSGAKTGRATMPVGLGSSSPARRSSAAHRRSIVAVASPRPADLADRGPGQRRTARRAGVHELGQDQRRRPERRPDIVAAGSSSREPEAADEDRARAVDVAAAQEVAPRALGIGEAIGTHGLGGPGAAHADQRGAVGRPEPQGRLEARLGGGGEQRDGIDRGDGRGRGGEPGRGRPVRAGHGGREAGAQRRRGDLHAPRTRPDGRHRAFSGNAAPSAMAASGTSAMRASPTPTDRRRIARSGG